MQLSPKNGMSIGQKVFNWISSVQHFSMELTMELYYGTTLHYGTCEKNFKDHYNNHTSSFQNKNKEKSTEPSKYIWEFKDNNIQHNLKSRIASKSHLYVCRSKKRNLCLTEKLIIIKTDPETLLNTRDELLSKCGHMNKFTLRHFKKN